MHTPKHSVSYPQTRILFLSGGEGGGEAKAEILFFFSPQILFFSVHVEVIFYISLPVNLCFSSGQTTIVRFPFRRCKNYTVLWTRGRSLAQKPVAKPVLPRLTAKRKYKTLPLLFGSERLKFKQYPVLNKRYDYLATSSS